MGFGASILLIAAGAVVRFGLMRSTWGEWNLHAVGVIAMVVGGLGFIVSTLVWAPRRRRSAVVTDSTQEHLHLTPH